MAMLLSRLGRRLPRLIVPVAVTVMTSSPDPAEHAFVTELVFAAVIASRSVQSVAETSSVVVTVIGAAWAIAGRSSKAAATMTASRRTLRILTHPGFTIGLGTIARLSRLFAVMAALRSEGSRRPERPRDRMVWVLLFAALGARPVCFQPGGSGISKGPSLGVPIRRAFPNGSRR